MKHGERAKGKENDIASIICHTTRCEGRGYIESC
jgi:hypothetical protein